MKRKITLSIILLLAFIICIFVLDSIGYQFSHEETAISQTEGDSAHILLETKEMMRNVLNIFYVIIVFATFFLSWRIWHKSEKCDQTF